MSVYSVNVYPSSTTIRTGNWYYGAYAVVNASSNCNTGVRWYSNNTSIATVNASSGYIYAKAPGTTRIYAQSTVDSSKKDYITVTVTSGTICVDSVTLNRSSVSLEKGDTFTLSATVCPTNATNKSITWRSSNTSVATVSGGVVTAKARGSAYIYAEAQDGSGEYDTCYVNVTEDILVGSVTVSSSSKTMTVGDSAYLYETVCPTNATNKCVRWSSSNSSIVSVNRDTGLVYAKKAGSATIYATATDGSGKRGSCSITVNAPISVTGVSVCPTSLTMNVGDIEYLCASIIPSNSTNQTVTWCSSNVNVATVGLYTGKVTAKKAGTTTITATTADGGFTASCILTVIIDTVTIKKDGAFNKVVFNKSGKVWHYINHDMIFDEDNMNNTFLIQRSNHNFFTYYNENDPLLSNTTPKEYTDEEIKLLYAIDPYGVANYVQRYASELFYEDDLAGVLGYKDRIFRLLFKRNPKYFARTLDNTWYETTDKSNLSAVLSESEEIFGMHPIYDTLTVLALCGFAIDIAGIVFSTSFFATGTIRSCIGKIGKACVRVLSIGEALVKNELISYTANSAIESAFEETDLAWAYNFVSLYDDLQEIADSIVAEPNYYNEILNYCAHDTGYEVYIDLRNGIKYKIDDICSAIDNY